MIRPIPGKMPSRARTPHAAGTLPAAGTGLRNHFTRWYVPVAVGVLHLLVCLLAFNPVLHTGGDNATYIALAQSLVERGDYSELWDPALRPHALYPPLFPGMLAVALVWGIDSWIQLKLVVVVGSSVAVVLSILWMRRVSTPALAVEIGLLLAVAPGVVELSHWVLSDVPFWAFTMLALWASTRVPALAPMREGGLADGRDDAQLRWMAAVAIGATLAYLTRSAGLPLVVALVALLTWRRQWPELGVLATVLAPPLLLWALRNAGVKSGGYLGYIWHVDPYHPGLGTIDSTALIARIGDNLDLYLSRFGPELVFGTTTAGWLTGGLLTIAAIAGWVRRLPRVGLPELLLPLYLGVLLLWPSTWAGTRFLLPIAPILLLYAGEVMSALVARAPRPVLTRAAVAALVATLLLPGLLREVRMGQYCSEMYRADEPFGCLNPEWRDLFTLASVLRGRLPDGAVVLSRKPTLVFALSGYPGRLYPMSADPGEFFRAAEEAGADYVVVDQVPGLTELYLHPVLLAARHQFCVVSDLMVGETALVRIERGGQPPEDGTPPNQFRSCPLAGLRTSPPQLYGRLVRFWRCQGLSGLLTASTLVDCAHGITILAETPFRVASLIPVPCPLRASGRYDLGGTRWSP